MTTFQRSIALYGALCLGAATMPVAHAQVEGLHEMMAHNSGVVGTRMLIQHDVRGGQLLERAALQGNALAKFNLGVAYAEGRIAGRPDPARALYWYQRAAAAGNASAAYNIGALYANGAFGAPDPVRAAKWMHRAAQSRHDGARRWLARSGMR